MNHEIHKSSSWAVAYDASLVEAPGADYFEAEYWRSRQALTGQAAGRGAVWFIEAPFGQVVLRRYLRGGWAAAVSREHYLYSGVSTSRSFREYHLLAAMHALHLPVPRPVAALCQHRGILSKGAILTKRLLNTTPLADRLPGDGPGERVWNDIGLCIRRFHDAGVWHADLNARNILLDAGDRVFLIDFDKARFSPGQTVDGSGNLKRLKRSLLKLWPQGSGTSIEAAWESLMTGYNN